MMAPPAYLQYKRSADHHLQVEIVDREELENRYGRVPVRARVRRVFKSTSNLQPNDELSFELKTFRMPDFPPPDAGGWIEYEHFKEVRYLEVYLDGQSEGLGVAAFGALHYSIDDLTEKPVVPRPSLFKLALCTARFKYGFWFFGDALLDWCRP